MGGEAFTDYGRGKTLEEAFTEARDRALWDHGHSGYTGTIAEKPGVTLVEHPEFSSTADAEQWAWEMMADHYDDDVVFSKWEDASAVLVAGESDDEVKQWLFFGVASS